MQTYTGKTVEGKVINFRPLTKEEREKYDDGSTIKIITISGSGDVISSRLSDYYNLITVQRIPATPATELLQAFPEENDRDYADRITSMAANYQRLKDAKREILCETYHKI